MLTMKDGYGYVHSRIHIVVSRNLNGTVQGCMAIGGIVTGTIAIVISTTKTYSNVVTLLSHMRPRRCFRTIRVRMVSKYILDTVSTLIFWG